MGRADSPLRNRMVFVVGARRSGTNWLEHLLTLHPAIAAVPGETHLFSHGIATLAERVQHGVASSAKTGTVFVERDTFLDATRDWCDAVFAPFLSRVDGAALLLERTPLHAQHLDLIAAVYPDAHVIHLVRDGTAVAISLAAQEWGPKTVAEAAREWADTVHAATVAQVPQFREVRHEHLAADPVSGIADLWQWLGLDVSDDLRIAVGSEAGKPVNTTTGKPGARPRPQRLAPGEAAAITTEAGAELDRLGYPLPSSRHRSARELAGTARRRLRPANTSPKAAAPSQGGALWYEQAQSLVDRLLTAMHTGDDGLMRAVTADDLQVRTGATSAQGDEARAALQLLCRERSAEFTSGAEVHPGNPTFTIVLPRDEVALIVEPHGSVIRRVVAYRFSNPVAD